MIRKFFLATAAAVALISPLAAVKSDAHEYHYEHHREYKVFYRAGCDSRWYFAGEFRHRHEAERVAGHYRRRGFEVFIR